MLNFFVQLVNTVGVPVILVGTYKSLSIFEGNFSQMRRGTGQGDLVWDRMQFDKEWKHFVKALWHFQYTQKFCILDENPELIEILYEETQGITDLAVKAYMLAQERAIETKKEIVSASIIRSVCRDKFKIIRPALEALKYKHKNALPRFEDAYPQFLEKFISESSDLANPYIQGEISNDPQIRNIISGNDKDENSIEKICEKDDSVVNDNAANAQINLNIWLEKVGKKNPSKDSSCNTKKALLPSILNSLEDKTNKSVHAALNEAGFIKSGNEFISGGSSL